MNKLPKWDEARTSELETFVGANDDLVSLETVAGAADQLGTTPRSVAAKLRKLGYEVEKTATANTKSFTEYQEDALRAFLEANEGDYTFAEIADVFEDGQFSPKQLQGKILSMELTHLVKPAEKKEYQRTYSEEAQATFVEMANGGAMIEDIAEALGYTVASVRGKALSLLRSGHIDAIPASNKVAKAVDAFQGLDVGSMTVEEIANEIDRSPRGVKTMLTRRGLVAQDYDGAARREKAARAAAQ